MVKKKAVKKKSNWRKISAGEAMKIAAAADKKIAAKKKAIKKKVVKKRTAKHLQLNDNGLTPLLQRYCDNLLLGDNDTDSYFKASGTCKSRAGAATSSGRANKNPAVIAFLDKRRAEIAEELGYGQLEWMKDALKLKRQAMGQDEIEHVATVEGAMMQLPAVKKFDGAVARATLDMLGKSKPIDMFNTKVELEVDVLDRILSLIAPTLGPPSKRGEAK